MCLSGHNEQSGLLDGTTEIKAKRRNGQGMNGVVKGLLRN
jgi:hypothetical protein